MISLQFIFQLSGTSLDQWVPPQVDTCRQLIYDSLTEGAIEEVAFENGEVVDRSWILHHFELDFFQLFRLLDDFGIQTACPGNPPSQSQHFAPDIQESFYSGYLQKYGLKEQIIYSPIGVIRPVFITEMRQNDNGIQNIS